MKLTYIGELKMGVHEVEILDPVRDMVLVREIIPMSNGFQVERSSLSKFSPDCRLRVDQEIKGKLIKVFKE